MKHDHAKCYPVCGANSLEFDLILGERACLVEAHELDLAGHIDTRGTA